ncbi:hypothetical protein BPAE_0262g00180 [Botrytis paeoniae]|uniref:Uncharacterized protein n=1 Tax=Botrytis paeoniae TaxID=278948 RepID=A0A4Z1FH86_9HELO|nr:hypothetical protein BPAE_0262g00180 [Botrytis paeoniae]
MSDQSTENITSNHPSLPNLDFGEIDITPPSLRRQSRPYGKPIGHGSELITPLPSSFSDASSLLDSSSRTSDIAIKSISSPSQARVHEIRHCLMEYYVDWKWDFFANLIVIACPFMFWTTHWQDGQFGTIQLTARLPQILGGSKDMVRRTTTDVWGISL